MRHERRDAQPVPQRLRRTRLTLALPHLAELRRHELLGGADGPLDPGGRDAGRPRHLRPVRDDGHGAGRPGRVQRPLRPRAHLFGDDQRRKRVLPRLVGQCVPLPRDERPSLHHVSARERPHVVSEQGAFRAIHFFCPPPSPRTHALTLTVAASAPSPQWRRRWRCTRRSAAAALAPARSRTSWAATAAPDTPGRHARARAR